MVRNLRPSHVPFLTARRYPQGEPSIRGLTVVGDGLRKPATSPVYAIVADGDLARALAYRQVIEQLALEAIVTRDGAEALAIMNRHGPPLLLVTDVSLPQVDGFALVRSLRQLAPASRAAAIMTSSFDELRALASSLGTELGISSVLTHSVSAAEFKSAVEAAIETLDARMRPSTDPSSPLVAGENPLGHVEMIVGEAVAQCVASFPELATTLYVRLDGHKWFRSASMSATGLSALPTLASLIRHVFETGETLVMPEIGSVASWRDAAGAPPRTFLAAPIRPTRDQTVGVLYMFGPRPMRIAPYELDIFHGIARKTAAALHPYLTVTSFRRTPAAVRLSPEQFDRLSREAIEDPLTGLTNRNGGEIAMGRELARARRDKRPLSLVLIDVDHFKKVNDSRGHDVGDHVLRGIARVATSAVRASDLVVRWGGEEFLVILPSVAVEGAREVAERIRCRIEQTATEPVRVTISAGTSEVEPSEDFQSAFARADTLLHRAKAEGRNRIF